MRSRSIGKPDLTRLNSEQEALAVGCTIVHLVCSRGADGSPPSQLVAAGYTSA